MATRIYLPYTAETTAFNPTPHSGWEETDQLVRAVARTTKIGDTLTFVSYTPTTDGSGDYLFRQYVSVRPIDIGTVITGSQALQMVLLGSEGASSLQEVYTALCVRIINVNGTVQKVLLAPTRDDMEMAGFTDTNRNLTATSAAGDYTTVADDYLVVEVGVGGPDVDYHQQFIQFGDSSANDLAANDSGTSNYNPWFQLTTTLTFPILGAASLSGAGTMSVAAQVDRLVSVVLTGTGSVAPAASATYSAAAVLTGTGSVAPAASATYSVAIALSSAGTLSNSSSTVTRPASLALSGTGTIAAATVVTHPATAALTAAGTLAPAAQVDRLVVAALTGTGSLAPAAQVDRLASSSLAASGSLTAVSGVTLKFVASLSGTGAVAATGFLTFSVASVVSGAGTVSPAGNLYQIGRPAGDISKGGWTQSAGSTLWEQIDEITADDGDYAYSVLSPGAGDTFEVSIASMGAPTGGTCSVIVRAYRGP